MKTLLKSLRILDRIINYVIMLVFVIILFIGAYMVTDASYVFHSASNNSISAYRPALREVEDGSGAVVQDLPFTEDYVAWISIDGTTIDYPIMQADNNSKYLNMDPYGEYSLSGSIFLDCRNASDFSDAYSMVYGHHMSGDYMFGALDKYYQEKFFDEHRDGVLIIDGIEYPIKAFAMLDTDAQESIVFNPQPGDDIVAYAKETALFYRSDVDGRVLALSTCKDPSNTTRTVVLFRICEVVAGEI